MVTLYQKITSFVIPAMVFFITRLNRAERGTRYRRGVMENDQVTFKYKHHDPAQGRLVVHKLKGTITTVYRDLITLRDENGMVQYVPHENILLP